MDTSIFKLLEEEEDEDESMLSKEDVDAFQASLLREIEGGNHSPSQQFAAWNNGIQDANTNNLHILESTQMEEQQQSVLRNQDQELKPEDESHLQHNLPQDHLQPDRRCENPSHVPQASNLQSRNNSITTEPESPQNMSSQRTHGVEQPVGSVNHGPTEVQVCELIHILIPQVDKDRGKQLRTLIDKLKSKEISKDRFLRQLRDIVGNQMIRLAISKLPQIKQEDKGLKVPDGPNHYRESFTSAEISDKRSDTCGVHVNQLPSTSLGTLSSSAIVHGLHNSERPTSVNGPSMVQGGPIFHLENNSSLPLNSAPFQGSVTRDQTRSPSSSVVHVKQKSTDQSFDQVNFSAPSGTTPAGSIVRTTPKMPCVGQKKPLEAQGSSLPPSSKRQRLCGTSFARSDEKFNDVTELSGINLMEEERKLLSSLPKKDSRVFNSVRRVVHEEEGRTILQKVPLQRKLKKIMAKSGLKHIKDDVERCLSLCVEERMRKLLFNIIRMSKQRTDAEKCRNRICITSDIRKQINEMNQKAKEEWEKKHGGKEKLKNEENDTAKEDYRSEQVKADKKEEAENRAKAANAAALASVGGDNAFSKWKLMVEARQKPSSVLGSNSKKLSGETGGKRFGKNHGSPKVVRSISVKDVIAVLEKEPQMSRSTLLYRLYNMICSDVPTQEKT